MFNKFTYFLAAGWAENRWKTHELLDVLERAGGTKALSAHNTDIFICHSAGGHIIPKGIRPKLLVIIAPAHLAGRPLVLAAAMEWVMDSIYCFRKLLILPWILTNIYYRSEER